ncbi:MAG: hypothetical protein Q8Q40_12275 [Methylococcaceae bacterium]|nr:hypothetical protein [Methylococcaceae bacterium]
MSPAANFGLRYENGELNSNFTWNQLFYNNQSELNIDEQLFGLDFKHKTEHFDWAFKNSYNNRSSLNTEDTGSGILFSQVMRKQLTLAPSVSYALDELNSLAFDYSYENTKYEKNQNALFLSDYDYHQLSGTFNHMYSERDKLNATLSTSRYKTPVQDQTTYNTVAQLGWQHSFSEQLVTYISAGLNYSQSESSTPLLGFIGFNRQGIPFYFDPNTGLPTSQQRFGVLENNAWGQVYRASIQKSFERSSVSLIGSQNQTPTSQGLQTRTEISLNNAYTINERWTSGLTSSYSTNEITGQQNSRFNRTYYTISPNINWKWTPEINLGLSYTYRQQEFQGSTQPSQGNIVQLQFNYQPQINRQVK